MERWIRIISLAELLHDVGKICYRAGWGEGRHSQRGRTFLTDCSWPMAKSVALASKPRSAWAASPCGPSRVEPPTLSAYSLHPFVTLTVLLTIPTFPIVIITVPLTTLKKVSIMQAITLLGDQVAPILMLANLLPGAGVLHVLTTTAKQARAEHLEALNMLNPELKTIVHVLKNHYDMRSLTAMARQLIGDGVDTLVDLTGGTKLMCLALYHATHGTAAKALYVDSEAGVIRDVTDAAGKIVSNRLPHVPSDVVFPRLWQGRP